MAQAVASMLVMYDLLPQASICVQQTKFLNVRYYLSIKFFGLVQREAVAEVVSRLLLQCLQHSICERKLEPFSRPAAVWQKLLECLIAVKKTVVHLNMKHSEVS